jgi:hypothetical protein
MEYAIVSRLRATGMSRATIEKRLSPFWPEIRLVNGWEVVVAMEAHTREEAVDVADKLLKAMVEFSGLHLEFSHVEPVLHAVHNG